MFKYARRVLINITQTLTFSDFFSPTPANLSSQNAKRTVS